MAIDPDRLMAIAIPNVEQRYDERDTIIYALGIGVGHDPLNEEALRYCYEKALVALPTMPLVISHPGFWMRDLDTGIDFTKIVHGEQTIEIHRPLPVAATVVSETRVVDILDKGEGRGAIVVFDRHLYDRANGDLLATMRQSNFCRGDGGFEGAARPSPKPPEMPDRPADHVVDLPTRPEAALLYRLSADLNPLHVEPGVARAAGFPRPILHGLATFGVVGHALLASVCGYDATRLLAMSGRFSSPVYPGEIIRTEIWKDGPALTVRARVPERNAVVLTGGQARLRE